MENKLDPEPKQKEPESKIIGITGGIGSGKTSVAKIFEEAGFPVYYSDDRAKQIVNDLPTLKQDIINLLGPEAYDQNGAYNRRYVGEKVFENNQLLEHLNHLIHPAVRLDFMEWASKQSHPFIFKETALLFELELDKYCFKSILVTADDNIRIKRVMDRNGKTYREVEKIMTNQMPEKKKIKKADYIIYNNTSLEDLQEETLKILSQLNDFI